MQKQYTNEQLYRIAEENYRLLSDYCFSLTEEGYFSKVEPVLHLSAEEVLDLYMQSLMLQFLVFGKRFNEEEILFAAGLTRQDMLGLKTAWEAGDLSEAVGKSAKFLEAPPILLQLFGLRDQEKRIGVTGLFFDSLLNVIICLSYLNQVRDSRISKFIGLYFDKVGAFLENRQDASRTVDGKYIFKKLCSGNLSEGCTLLRDAGEDFSAYKQKYFYYRHRAGASPMAEAVSEHIEAEEEIREFLPDSAAETAREAVSHRKEKESGEEIDRLTEELNRMVGLSEVKEEIRSLVNLIKVKRLREKYKLPQMNMSYHMVFTGSPGTGKTTVARLVAQIYKELGILSKGTLTETDRSGLVAGYVGQTALKVKETVERAIGGVLFIDEAYALAPENAGNDFGTEAIDTLVKLMEDHRDDFVVIVAGYTDEMQRFLKANTGLYSRFNKFIRFTDYTNEELLAILDSMASETGFCLTEGARRKVERMLSDMDAETKRGFGNARGIRNLFERLVSNQANRIIEYSSQSIKDITVITEEDVTG
ncbi:MAG: AAA family ATPase [Lachnospiraceae bacterium]|nr:AAA family ATPase [Lachnospiraceae bacterium]